jgi:2-amino-4-hydroxy-6-hydroxymethyldihydropteridine diphosphokinase
MFSVSPDHPRFTIIALGSNLGDSLQILREAMPAMEALSDEPILRSSFWKTTPIDCPPGSPPFLNAVVGLIPLPDETPERLLFILQFTEKQFGRRPKLVINEPRPLDLDLIAFGREKRSSPALTLPHPRAHLRRFVLAPLAEIAPEYKFPNQEKTVAELLSELRDDQEAERLQI